jgi:hypothetical protein
MRFFVHCDKQGNITSTMKVDVMDEALEHPYGQVEEDHVVLELKMPKAVADLDPHDITRLYRVDVKQKKLRKLPGAPATKSAKKVSKKPSKKPAKKSSRKARK